MLDLQNRMNSKVNADWMARGNAWYRAAWIECGELMDHYGYKWWKKQTPDLAQVQLEIVDIWHFGMSALFREGVTVETLADEIIVALDGHRVSEAGVLESTEALAEYCLRSKGFSVPLFWDLMTAAELSFDDLYKQYVGKNVLNFFRQDHGYKDGSYIKIWQGQEDNVHLVEILANANVLSPQFADDVYQGLSARYPTA
ncbi:dUTP diphosphatase [uncultured Zhongshania sp.]|uniref:dUTP diphosphatase n=1 Tax=uncultured Zhongshania sp. TaxID=1642288 RepID=UPI0030DB80BC|tara:strand:- start:3322 stop:3918 length:597 start_codon:yes stop_codon:yes gene_type:complete